MNSQAPTAIAATNLAASRITLTTTVTGEPTAVMLYKTDLNAQNGFAVYRSGSDGTSPPTNGQVLGEYIIGGSDGATFADSVRLVGIAEGTWTEGVTSGYLECRLKAAKILSITSSAVSSHITTKIATITSDVSFVGVSACFGNGTKSDLPIKVGAPQTSGFYYWANTNALRTVVEGVDVLACDLQSSVPVVSIADGTHATSRFEIIAAEATGAHELYWGNSSAGTRALAAFGQADNDLEFSIANPSAESVIAKITHGSGASGTGFWVYDTAGAAVAEVQVCAADTGGTGFRALVLPN